MTNEQKAIKIATKEGWQFDKQDGFWYHEEHLSVDVYLLTERYLTDLNWLVPVAVKVRNTIDDIYKNQSLICSIRINKRLLLAEKTPEGTYQPLFNAVYEAIVYLENQNA